MTTDIKTNDINKDVNNIYNVKDDDELFIRLTPTRIRRNTAIDYIKTSYEPTDTIKNNWFTYKNINHNVNTVCLSVFEKLVKKLIKKDDD